MRCGPESRKPGSFAANCILARRLAECGVRFIQLCHRGWDNIVKDPVHIHDLNATALHLLGIDHTRLTHRFQGRDYRLTDVHGHIVSKILV